MSGHWTLSASLGANLDGNFPARAEERLGEELFVSLTLRRREETACSFQDIATTVTKLTQLRDEIGQLFRRQIIPSQMLALGRHLADMFELDELFKQAELKLEDVGRLTIDTRMTMIPWDLMAFGDAHLATQLPIGFVIPGRLRGTRNVFRSSKNPARLVHVIGRSRVSPVKTLEHDQRTLATLVEGAGLRYESLVNPRSIKLGMTLKDSRWSTPFVLFTGHIRRSDGEVRFELGDDNVAMGPEDLRHCLKGTPDLELVFMNGCDSFLDAEQTDSFLGASLANACLAGGASAVIAPRTAIAGDTAEQAALAIWELILKHKTRPADAVRDYRRAQVEKDGKSIAGYSYVLYGDPGISPSWQADAAHLVLGKRSSAGATTERLPPEPVSSAPIWSAPSRAPGPTERFLAVAEAASEVNGEVVEPRHLFGALCRTWLVAHRFYALFNDYYIQVLQDLLAQLGVEERVESDAPPSTVRFSEAAESRIRAALVRSPQASELDLLAELVEQDREPLQLLFDANLNRIGTPAELLASAHQWVAAGAKAPPALVLPNGLFNPARFLAEQRLERRSEPPASRADGNWLLSRWDLTLGLVAALPAVAAAWRRHGLPSLSENLRWTVAKPLAWDRLSDGARAAMLGVFRELRASSSASEVLTALTQAERWPWNELSKSDPEAFEALTRAGFDAERWQEALTAINVESLALPPPGSS